MAGSGFYTNKPHFGNLLRAARHLGFRLVAYESEMADREQGQAGNLLAATIARQPDARVLVLAGHAHISEAGALGGRSMAQWVRQLAHLDPLTINQTQAATDGLRSWQRLPAGAYLVDPKTLSTVPSPATYTYSTICASRIPENIKKYGAVGLGIHLLRWLSLVDDADSKLSGRYCPTLFDVLRLGRNRRAGLGMQAHQQKRLRYF